MSSNIIDKLESMLDKTELNLQDMEFLKSCVQRQDVESLVYVTRILAVSRTEKSKKILMNIVTNPDDLVRANACDSLGIFDDMETMELLSEIAQTDESELVVSYALLAIGDIIKTKKYESTIFKDSLENTKSEHVRLAALRGLYLTGDESVLWDILQGLKSNDYAVRCFCVNILSDIRADKNQKVIDDMILQARNQEQSRAVISCMDDILE